MTALTIKRKLVFHSSLLFLSHSSFSTVVGHDTAVKEAARHTVKRRNLDEMHKSSIVDQLREIESQLPDALKTGGQYITKIGKVKKIIVHESVILMSDGTRISIEEIYSVHLRKDLL